MVRTKSIYCFLFLSMLLFRACAQEYDYARLFGKEWIRSVEFITTNKIVISTAFKNNSIPECFGMALVFPELIRFSVLRNQMETGLLKSLYVYKGVKYANFSIGYFQMKPSFAELVLKESLRHLPRKVYGNFKAIYSTTDSVEYRRRVVASLESLEGQLYYLIAFYQLCEQRWQGVHFSDSAKLKLYAAAYNSGLQKSNAQLWKAVGQRQFYTSLFQSSELYCYSDIALFYYSRCSNSR